MKQALRFFLLFFFLFVAQSILLLGQEPIRYSTKNGLPSNHVYDIQEDKDGFIWIATNRGLVKFDGYEFKIFTHKNGLPNNDIVKLRLDAQKRLWFFSKSSLQGFVQNDSVFVYPTYQRKVLSPRNVYAYPDGLTMSLQQEKFVGDKFIKNPNYVDEDSITEKFPGYKIFHIQYNHQFFFIGENKVELTDEKFNVLREINYGNSAGSGSFTINYYPDETFTVKGNSHVFFVNAKTLDIKVYSFADLGITENRTVLVKKVRNQYQVTSKKRLVILNNKFEIVRTYNLNNVQNPEFSLLDSFGNIWVWNTKNGIEFIPKSDLNSKYYLLGDKITVIGKMNVNLVSSSELDGTFIFDSKDKKFQKNKFFNEDIDYMVPYQISRVNDADYLFTQSVIFKNERGKWSKFTLDFDGETFYGGKDYITHNGQQFFITPFYFLAIEPKVKIRDSGLNDLEVWNDTVFIGSTEGLKYFANKQLNNYFTSDTLMSLPINHLRKGKRYLWLGTDGRGVYGVKNGKISHLKSTVDLSITGIIEEGNILWLSTNKGIKKIALKEPVSESNIFDEFYQNDGLIQDNVNSFVLNNQKLWVATDLGVSVIDPNAQFYKRPLKIYFTNANKELIVQKNDDRNLNISFSVRDYSNQDHIKFYYKLSPLQNKWVESPTRTLSFSELVPRDYTLEVIAMDQHHNTGKTSLTISVKPKWYETHFAMVVFALLSLLFVIGLVVYINRVYQKRRMKAIEMNRKTHELELMALRSQMNPHFVHNSLNAIQYYVQMNDVDKSEEYLTKFSELIRLFFEYSREKEISLDQEIDLLSRYIEIEQLRFEDKITYFIHIDERLDTRYQKIPTMILQPLIENSINHGLFHKKGVGRIDIYFNFISENEFQVIIKDNGIGIEKAKEIQAKSVKNYRSHSSMVLEERLQLLNETKHWGINFSLDSNSEGENTGTKIVLSIKNYDL